MRDLVAAPNGRALHDLFRGFPEEYCDTELGRVIVDCLRLIGYLDRPRTFAEIKDELRRPTRTIRRHIARLRRAGFGINYRRGRDQYVFTGFYPRMDDAA